MKEVIVIGAGIGGLTTGIRLLQNGYRVTILEKESSVGGKINQIKNKGDKFDLTASILMTPQNYTEIFNYVNKDYSKYIDLVKLDTMYKVFYQDNTNYEFYSDISKTIKFLESIDCNLGVDYLKYISNSYSKYVLSNENFLNKPMENLKEILNFESVKTAIKLNPIPSSYKYTSRYIKNNKIRDFLLFQCMYIGIDPYENSNLYTLIPAISQLYGLWYIKGGMYSYIKSLEKLFCEMGGKIYINKEVNEILIDKGIVKGVSTSDRKYSSDIVVCNADFPYAIKKLIREDLNKDKYKDKKIEKLRLSCSTLIIYLGLNKKYKNLKVNNIYIGENFKENIQAPFKGNLPNKPSFYMYCPSKIDHSVCGDSKEILNIMIRVPNLEYENIEWNERLVKNFRDKVMQSIAKVKGMEDIEKNIIYEKYLTPKDIETNFNAYKGCAFGIAHNISQIGYLRPHIKSKSVKNLYFIGSSTHPGNGASVIVKGSKLIADEIIKNS
ncbi:MAG: phytoene desaturase [Paraclostridium bifermentans]|uniref:phytoene desaturase family protein n=1 Tax=Paraclostridium bifermentans TaxID=1490 RepID=UPI0011DD8FD2|nr:phytoene desaturase family protein [Paraclostridium bifermentans]MBS6508581.1 phytoene desaturase [Paraclostridium bifermentans]